MSDSGRTHGLTGMGKAAVTVFIVGCLAGAGYYLFGPSRDGGRGTPGATGAPVAAGSLEVGVAYGTEKQRWLEWAVREFAKTSEGEHVHVNLIPMGSIEAAHAILAGDARIHAWSPASAVYEDTFLQDWQIKFGGTPFVREETLALTPMAFVVWEERYQAFVQKFGEVTFTSIAQALQERGGWEGIAGRPEWGLFKFGHTHPNQSNSGVWTILLAAHSYHKKATALTMNDILDSGFQQWLDCVERGVSGMSNSTGTIMRDMVLKGPSSYDAAFVYESVAIDFLKNAEGRWGRIRVVYPEYNAWNENPCYVLDASWSSREQRKAANSFLNFLLTERVQREALVHGFRPGNTNVAVKTAGSPFVEYSGYGVQVEVRKVCQPPKADVLQNLLAAWQRSQGGD